MKRVKKGLQTESIPLLLSQAERQFDGEDSDCFLSSDDMTPFKKHNIYYKSRWARVSSLLFCGFADVCGLTLSVEIHKIKTTVVIVYISSVE
ncbi:Hypothetical protein CINCED_3A019765 [Cinara cedri]|uniref:Uncharacterized protein n=1 Tax=Cinara cedri TaxID=506608 RepID=A0A5E4M256_9HEMI|nr:Hypothetical protein CINCED_3A019765 [Cinara cedri]